MKELFVSRKELFQETKVEVCGKQETIRYYSIDLLWGQKLYQELRFVLVEMRGVQSILTSTSLKLDPLAIIRLYSYRFKIECMFRELKQQTGAFCYHFWSKYMPKLRYFRKKEEPTPLELVKTEKARKKVLDAIRATEMHIALFSFFLWVLLAFTRFDIQPLSCIAMGILQIHSLRFTSEVKSCRLRFQRTPSKERLSEGALMHYFRKHFSDLSDKCPNYALREYFTTAGRVRNLLGFTGFLVVQTFNSQVPLINIIR